jgi:hypothetical protein
MFSVNSSYIFIYKLEKSELNKMINHLYLIIWTNHYGWPTENSHFFLLVFLQGIANMDIFNNSKYFTLFCIGEEREYRPFHDLRSVPEAGRPREQIENH